MLTEKQSLILKGLVLIFFTIGIITAINNTQDMVLFLLSDMGSSTFMDVVVLSIKAFSYLLKGIIVFFSCLFMSGLMSRYDSLE